MADRKVLDHKVHGGHEFRGKPYKGPFDDQTKHAQGRSQAEAEKLFNLVKLKSVGIINEGASISLAGASVQDFERSPGYTAAHRSIGGLYVNNQPIWNIPTVARIPFLKEFVWAPEARTDFVQPGFVNYADGMIERAAMPDVLRLFRAIVSRQPAGKPVEYNLLADGVNALKHTLSRSYYDVMNDYDKQLERRVNPLYTLDRILRSPQLAAGFKRIAAAGDPLDAPRPLAGRMEQYPAEDPNAAYPVIGLQLEEHARFSPDLVATDVIKVKSAQVDKIISDSNRSTSA